MSTQYGRLAEARDKARPIAPDETAEVYAADLDAVLTHYAKISDELAFARTALKAVRQWDVDRALDILTLSGGVDFALPQSIREVLQAAVADQCAGEPITHVRAEAAK